VADYGVNIKVAVQNAQKIQDLGNQLKRTGAAVDQQNTKLAVMAGKTKDAIANVKNLNATLAESQKNFNKAVLGTQSFVAASKDLITTNREVTRSLEQRAAALKRIESGQASDPTLMGSAASQRQSQFAKLEAVRRRALRASNKETLDGLRDVQQKIGENADLERTKAQKSLEIKKRAAEFRVNQSKKEQKLEENLGRIGLARRKQQFAMARDRQQLQNALGKMEERSKSIDESKARLQQKSLRLGRQKVQAVTKEVLENKKLTREQEKQLTLQRQQRNQKLGGAISSGLIGGGFPLLFGQGGAAAAGGAIGGLAGGAIGGGFGFALSIVGTAIGQAVEEAEEFNKALAAVNAKAVKLGSASQGSAKDVKELAKQLRVTKDEALELVAAFSEFESFADKQALASIFGDDASAFNSLAAAKTELDLAKEIFATRDDIGVGEAKRLLNMLKIQDASVVELALAESRLQAEHDIAVEQAKQITIMDRLRQSVAAGFGGGVIDIEAFGEERAEKLDAKFLKEREERLDRFVAKLKEIRELMAGVEFFDPGKPLTTAETGDSIEQRLKKQLAQYEEIDPFVRKRAVIEADHLVTLEKISKVKDEVRRKDLEILAGQVRQARLNDVEAQKAEKRIKEQISAAKALASLEMRLAKAQSGLPGAFSGPFSGSKKTAFLGQQEIDFELQTRELEIQDALNRGLTEKAEKLKAARDQYELYETQILEATVAQQQFNEALALAKPVTDSLFDSLYAVVEGTKTAEQAFADFLRNIASILQEAAKDIIATYIAIGVARMFAGFAADSAGSQGNPFGNDVVVKGEGGSAVGGGRIPLNTYAEGGYISGPTNALIGEGGQPEYVIPASKMTEAMGRYARGARGAAVIPEGDGASTEGGMGGGFGVVDVRYSVERINNVDYVTAAEFERGMNQAAKRGAELGRQGVYSDLVNKRSIRSRIGV